MNPPAHPHPRRRSSRRPWWLALLAASMLVLVACGAPPNPDVPGGGEDDSTGAIEELIESIVDGEVVTEIEITTLTASSSQSMHTYASAFEDTPLIVEAIAKTPTGREFKIVFYGPSIDTSLVGFSGAMRIRARVATIQGKRVLRGTALMPETAAIAPSASKHVLAAYPFIAGGMGTVFAGPAVGTVYELHGYGTVTGLCSSTDVAGGIDIGPPGGPAGRIGRGVFVSTLPEKASCSPGSGLAAQVQASLFATAVDTHMGTFVSGPGWIGAPNGQPLATFALLVGEELPDSVGFVRVVPAAGVRVVDALAGAALTSFDSEDGTLYLTGLEGSLVGLAVDDVIVSTPRGGAAHGFLRRVTAIETIGGTVAVRTTRAVLKDAIQEAEVRFSRTFTQADVALATLGAAGADAMLSPQTLFGPIDLNIDQVLVDLDGDHGTSDDQVRVTGDFFMEPRIVIDLDCSGFLCTRPDFLAKFVLEQSSDLNVTAELAQAFDEPVQLARIPLPPITAAILVFVPEIVIELTASGDIQLSMEFRVEQSLDLQVGVEYQSGSGWDTIDVLSHTSSVDAPTFAAELTAEAALGVEGRLMLYGVAGVSAGLELYATLEAGIPRTPAWEVRGGLRGDVDVDLDVIVWQEEFSIPVFDTDWPIASAPNAAPEITNMSAGPQCSDGTVALDVFSGTVTLDANTDDAEDGRGGGSVVWSSNLDGALGTTVGGGHTLETALSTGHHVITARAIDEAGAEDVDTLEIDVDVVCLAEHPVGVEVVAIGAAPGIFTPGMPKGFEARTWGGFGANCCALDWYSDVEGYLGTTTGSTRPDDRLHTFEHTFTQPVGQTITAVATYGNGETEANVELLALVAMRDTPNLGDLSIALPTGGASYEGDAVNLVLDSAVEGLVWSSTDPTDVMVPGVAGEADVTFGQAGPRTLRAVAHSDDGGITVRSVRLRVDDILARP